jgi:hypothetical protein
VLSDMTSMSLFSPISNLCMEMGLFHDTPQFLPHLVPGLHPGLSTLFGYHVNRVLDHSTSLSLPDLLHDIVW